jgi:S1-C subfamily serine protease
MSRNRRFSFNRRVKAFSRRRVQRVAIGVGCAVLGSAILCAEEAAPSGSVAEAISQEVRQVFEKCRSAVVRIEAIDIHGPLSGTGFYIDPNGTILTSYTVGGESSEIVVSGKLEKMPARRLVSDPRCGVAILKVDAETPFLILGKSRELGIAAPVMTIGYPMDLPVSPSFGTVAGFDIKFAGRYFATAHIRANVPVQRGQGGAPLLNLRGEVVGIMISSLDAGSAAFALPIDAAEKVRKDYVRFGEVRPGWLGIAVHTSVPPTAGSTAQIDELVADAPGARAGLAKDDIILEIGDRKIRSTEDVLDAAFFTTADDELPIKVMRDGKEIVVNTIPADNPNSIHAPHPSGPRLQAIPTGISRVLPTPAPLIDGR